jgi:hypothetical protein
LRAACSAAAVASGSSVSPASLWRPLGSILQTPTFDVFGIGTVLELTGQEATAEPNSLVG